MSGRRGACGGFTLVEMLVVIAIIGLLAMLALGPLVTAKRAAQKCQCISNLRQVGLALSMYSMEWNDHMLPDWGHMLRKGTREQIPDWKTATGGTVVGLGKLCPSYLGSIELLFCPVDAERDEHLMRWKAGMAWVRCSYVWRGVRGGASPSFSKNDNKVLVMQFMRKERFYVAPGHNGTSVPVLWGDGSVRALKCTLAHAREPMGDQVNFNPVTTIKPFLWADQQPR
jgi:prepilin-type N-terminal cleavage/methylation domain-containing protein/prepilin-type processing-associated H-X9-DG protein